MPKRQKLPKIPTYEGMGINPDNAEIQKARPLQSLSETDLTLPEFKILDAYLARINKGVSKATITLLAGGLAYLAMPIDLVPDFIPVAGWLDDAAVLGWIFARCTDEFKKYKASKNPSPQV